MNWLPPCDLLPEWHRAITWANVDSKIIDIHPSVISEKMGIII